MLRSRAASCVSLAFVLVAACRGDDTAPPPDMASPPDLAMSFLVLAQASSGGSIGPASQTVAVGATATFTVTPDEGYGTAEVIGCGGTLVGDTYTTAPITESCAVSAVFALGRYMVTTSAGTGGSISPGSVQVDHGATASFTVTPDASHTIETVTGCGGTLDGNTYTIAAATADCVVTASFAALTHTVTATAGAGGMLSPATQTVAHGAMANLAVTIEVGKGLLTISGCGGTLSGTTYTTGPITADCTVSASFVALNRIWAGGFHTCAVSTGGGLRCWGQNSSGQLGNAAQSMTAFGDENGEAATNAPIFAPPAGAGLSLTDLSLGTQHSCSLWSDGKVYCNGEGQNGQLGIGINADRKTVTLPVDLGGVRAIQVSAGGQFSCALLETGRVKCWGLNSSGELGLGDGDTRYAPTNVVGFGTEFATKQVVQICTGSAHACARTATDEVFCWGDNSSGQLGDNDGGNDSGFPAPVVNLGAGVTVRKLACGGLHTCALLSTGVRCWGENGSGQLGNNDGTNTDLDVASALLNFGAETVVDIAGGGEHACALTATGKVYCWGESDAGQTGQSDVVDDITPQLVNLGAYTATALEAGFDHSCVALLPNAAGDTQRPFRCWGEGGVGQLGLSNTNDLGDNEAVSSTAFNLIP